MGAQLWRREADTQGMNTINSVAPSSASALASGLSTIAAGTQRLDQDAQQIANPDQTSTGSLLDLPQAAIQAQAGADVIRASNQMLGSLFDAFA
jgi:hypothetical protein